MAAGWPMFVLFFVATALMVWGACFGVGVRNVDFVFVHMAVVRMMQMVVVQVIDMIFVMHSYVSAIFAMLMVVSGV
jgi:hypothetical protein